MESIDRNPKRDFIFAEVTPFPKGHVAIANSWSHPESKCALDKIIGEQRYRGPVRFHLEIAGDDGRVA